MVCLSSDNKILLCRYLSQPKTPKSKAKVYFDTLYFKRFFLFQGKEINANDRFYFNESFSHKLYKIKINQVQLRETVTLIFPLVLIGQNNIGQNFRHLDRFHHFCPIKHPEMQAFLDKIFVTFVRHCFVRGMSANFLSPRNLCELPHLRKCIRFRVNFIFSRIALLLTYYLPLTHHDTVPCARRYSHYKQNHKNRLQAKPILVFKLYNLCRWKSFLNPLTAKDFYKITVFRLRQF